MILLHVTRRACTHGIDREGVSPAYSQGKMAVSWFVSLDRVEWAIVHVQQRHGVELGDVVIYTVELPYDLRERYRRWCRQGVYWCPEVTPPEWLVDRACGLDWGYGLTESEKEAFDREAENLSDARG